MYTRIVQVAARKWCGAVHVYMVGATDGWVCYAENPLAVHCVQTADNTEKIGKYEVVANA